MFLHSIHWQVTHWLFVSTTFFLADSKNYAKPSWYDLLTRLSKYIHPRSIYKIIHILIYNYKKINQKNWIFYGMPGYFRNVRISPPWDRYPACHPSVLSCKQQIFALSKAHEVSNIKYQNRLLTQLFYP